MSPGTPPKRFILIAALVEVLLPLAGIVTYGLLVEPKQIEISHFSAQGLGPSGMTAVQLSDIHIKELGVFESEILSSIRSIDPDFIFLTGDYVPWGGNYDAALEFLAKLSAKAGVWAVMGDYDYSNSRKSCSLCHMPGNWRKPKFANIRFLRNSCQEAYTPAGSVLVCGVDEKFPSSLPNIQKSLNSKSIIQTIILSHSPLYIDKLRTERNFLMLSGDTHGGQIPLPNWLYKLFGYEKNARYNYGLFQIGNKTMFVSRGVGTSHIPIRVLRKPEIVVIHF